MNCTYIPIQVITLDRCPINEDFNLLSLIVLPQALNLLVMTPGLSSRADEICGPLSTIYYM